MNLSLSPDIQHFIQEQVRSGRFPSPEAVVEAAVGDLRDASASGLDDATVEAINEAEAQADRGEGMELAPFREHISKRFTAR